MLLAKTYLAPSAIHGIGLFAKEAISAGTVVWSFTAPFDLDLDVALLDKQPEAIRSTLLHYGYVDRRSGRYILCCDDARFINHSGAPNLGTIEDGSDFALRDIAAGEELTIDYASFEDGSPVASKDNLGK